MDIKQFQNTVNTYLKTRKEGDIDKLADKEAKIRKLSTITITVFAMVLSVATMLGGKNATRIMETNIEVTNSWAFYQAKSIKQNLYYVDLEDTKAQLEDATTPANVKKILSERAIRYQQVINTLEDDPSGNGKKQIMAEARKLEAERDSAKKRSPLFGLSSTAFQIAIVLSTTAILGANILLWGSSIAVGLVGLALLADGIWYFYPLAF
jgi:Domain of unknown function (DUF4337)